MGFVSAFVGHNNRSGLGIGVLTKKKIVNSDSGIEMRGDIVGRHFSVGLMFPNVVWSEPLTARCAGLAFQGCLYRE